MIWDVFKGQKTYAVAVAIIAYVLVSKLTGAEADQDIVNALLGGGLFTLRHGMNSSNGNQL